MTRKWNIVNYNAKVSYGVVNKITYNTELLKSNLRVYNNSYILVKGNIAIKGHQHK